MAEDESECCPLCMEELDLTDKNFNACQCGYQVCLWCWHQIKNEYNGLCPACRTPYSEKAKQQTPQISREDVVRRAKQRKQKERAEKKAYTPSNTTSSTNSSGNASSSASQTSSINRRNLTNVRVIQRNLVYVIGLPVSYANEEKLRRYECFGQYGRIVKIVVNKSHINSDRANATASAYVTFSTRTDAYNAIKVIDGFCLDGKLLRASFGTTKYCNFFLRNLTCSNPECLYLHELGDLEDSFTKEEMQAGRATFRDSLSPNFVPSGPRSGSSFPPCIMEEIQLENSSTKSADSNISSRSDSILAAPTTPSNALLGPWAQTVSGNRNDKELSKPKTPRDRVAATYSQRVGQTSTESLPLGDFPSLTSTMSSTSHTSTVTTTASSTKDSIFDAPDEKAFRPINPPLPPPPVSTGMSSTSQISRVSHSESLLPPPTLDSPVNGTYANPTINIGNGLSQLNTSTSDDRYSQSTSHVISPSLSTSSTSSLSPLRDTMDGSSQKIRITGNKPSSQGYEYQSNNVESTSTFASVDASFGTTSIEPTEALASLLGVQLTGTLSAQAKLRERKNSSRFAFANDNQEKPVHSEDHPLGTNSDMGSFGYYPSTAPATPQPGLSYNTHPSSHAYDKSHPPLSGLAFLQQMLPNVNISYGQTPAQESKGWQSRTHSDSQHTPSLQDNFWNDMQTKSIPAQSHMYQSSRTGPPSSRLSSAIHGSTLRPSYGSDSVIVSQGESMCHRDGTSRTSSDAHLLNGR